LTHAAPRAVTETLLKALPRGSHRIVAPSEILTQFRRFALQTGITRLGNVPSRDRIGIPVAIPCGPIRARFPSHMRRAGGSAAF